VKKLLVANRGEIARRVMRSCRELGVRTVAVYSDADAGAAHVVEADEAYNVGPAAARLSYLNTERILDVAQLAGADAVHPGYGFMAEDADFADKVVGAGLVWVGPRPDVIRLMGDKQRARETALAAGVPVVPGSRRFHPDTLDGLREAAGAVGYPLLVKAVAGGGGIGMRRVDLPERLNDAAAATQALAAKNFGDGSIFLERFIPNARHVEVQVFGFGSEGAIHLFERDCSLQRRFQKVIEESPAPGVPDPVLGDMADAAVRLARAVEYEGAGTVEFILDADTHSFHFLEMNTRIQVEHPVTEAVTGRDLVNMQIEFASGSLRAVRQPEITRSGHAIECRVYAEDPARMFIPSPGRLEVFSPPVGRAFVRVDSGYRAGDVVTPFYDPMIAKVIAWGQTRDEARQTVIGALADFEIEGLRTNKDFLIACLSSPAFVLGRVSTRLIETDHRHLLTAMAAGT
jgi:3-methylcrotonyl-CoA carboxylase alpha subunit